MNSALPTATRRRIPTPTNIIPETSILPKSTDKVKSAILASSSSGWGPLRIQKRDGSSSPSREGSPVAPLKIVTHSNQIPMRRTSASYKHIRTHSLVSESPFKKPGGEPIGPKYQPKAARYAALSVLSSTARQSKIPTPATRRPSGEKRRRSQSVGENESPGSQATPVVRRRQSKGLDGLEQAKYVAKSPFRASASQESVTSNDRRPLSPLDAPEDHNDDHADQRPSTPPSPAIPLSTSTSLPVTPPRPARVSALSSPASTPASSPSPRSNLVSKRLRGPRSPSHSPTPNPSLRYRRKTVTFDERCDVLEFDTDEFEHDGNVFESEDEESDRFNGDDHDEFHEVDLTNTDSSMGNDTNDSIDYRPINYRSPVDFSSPVLPSPALSDSEAFDGLVSSILDRDLQPQNNHDHYPRLPSGMETEDGVPYGRSHHRDRVAAAHHHQLAPLELGDFSFDSAPDSIISSSTVTEQQGQSSVDDVSLLPPSPTPARQHYRLEDSLEDEMDMSLDQDRQEPSETEDDQTQLFDRSHDFHESGPDTTFSAPVLDKMRMTVFDSQSFSASVFKSMSPGHGKVDDSSASSRNSVSKGSVLSESSATSMSLHNTSPPASMSHSQKAAPAATTEVFGENDFGVAKRNPALTRVGTENGLNGSLNGRSPRISREEVKKRLLSQKAESANVTTPPHRREFAPAPPPTLDRPLSIDISRTDVDLTQVQSALDKLMLGVERGFGDDSMEDDEGEGEASGNSSNMSVGELFGDGIMSAKRETQVVEEAKVIEVAKMSPSVMDFFPKPPPVPSKDTLPPLPFLPSLASELDITASSIRSNLPLPPLPTTARKASPTSSVLSGKEAIRAHEAAIIANRREMRRRERGGFDDSDDEHELRKGTGGRPSKRRSLSTGDAEDMKASAYPTRSAVDLLDVHVERPETELAFRDSVNQEIQKIYGEEKNRKYNLRQRTGTIYASSSRDRVSHIGQAGDVHSGKAWRTVRRPSDMNEYSRQIKEYRAQEKPGKVHGKVFVKVLGIRAINLPLPSEPTFFTCTLNNGIHFVTTPEFRLGRDSRIDQEFELIEHTKLEFTLTLKVRRDPHIIAQMKAASTPLPPPPPPASPSKGGMRSFFSSPKKTPKQSPKPQPQKVVSTEDNLAKYLRSDGVLARAFISFKDIQPKCDTRLFETSYTLVGQWTEDTSRQNVTGRSPESKPTTVGEIVLQIFRLPPLPGIPADQLPQSLDECQRGLRHTAWHKVKYHEGTLTQIGGDCASWRRRQFQMIGATLVAFNDVTKKPTVTIELKHVINVRDNDEPRTAPLARGRESFDSLYKVERSFRLVFKDDDEITFFADTDEEKAKWLNVLRALVRGIPINPLWGELLWQRQEEIATLSRSSLAPPPPLRK